MDFEPQDFYRIACAFAARFQPKIVALGHDVRESSSHLWQQVADGLRDSGVNVLDLGQISTDMLYFAVVQYQTDGGIIISASHNPAAYNGMKLVRQHAVPLSSETGLFDVRDAVESKDQFEKQIARKRGNLRTVLFLDAYLAHLRSFVNLQQLLNRRIVINANGGLAGHIAECLLTSTQIQICKRLFSKPDGTFTNIPKGRPDPLRPENRELTIEAVKQTGADLAVAWDADADRCFFFDENGEFVEGCYITATARGMPSSHKQQKQGGIVIFDPRAIWAVENSVTSANGTPLLNRCGHSFIKIRMRETDALFAGEASGHYYFRDNFYADNGMLPFLYVLELLCAKRSSLAELVNPLRAKYPVSGEINFAFENRNLMHVAMNTVERTLPQLGDHFHLETPVDGVSVQFLTNRRGSNFSRPEPGSWRFNLRESNTEPLLRFNLETITDFSVLMRKTEQLSEMLENLGGRRETKFRWEDR